MCLDHLQVSGLNLDPKGTIFSILDPDTDRIRIKVNIHELNRHKMEPWRAVDANNGGVDAQNGAVEGLLTGGRRFASL